MTRRTPDADDDSHSRKLLGVEEDILATYDQQLADLAQKAIEGGEDVDIALSQLIEVVPDSVRVEIIKRFRQLVQEFREVKELPPLTPEQEKALEQQKLREQVFIAHWLSEKTLEKIRRAMISNPLLMKQITEIGEKLFERGMLMEHVTSVKGVAISSPQPVLNPEHRKRDGKESGKS